MNETVEQRIHQLFEELVPFAGKTENLAGEIIRAICRIGYRFSNDGDHLGIGYGKETCNPAGRFLKENTNEEIAGIVGAMWGNPDESAYEKQLDSLAEAVLEYVESHPELRTRETEDMFSYYDADEDVDDYDEDDEW